MRSFKKTGRSRALNSRAVLFVVAGIGLLVLGSLSLVMLAGKSASSQPDAVEFTPAIPAVVNFKAPELTLKDIQGEESSLAAYDGQVVLVNNWAFWCLPCRAELPILQRYYQAHQDEKFTIIGIEAGGEADDVIYHVNLYKLKYPVWLDPGELSLRAFGNLSLPNSYVIDRTGIVRLAWSGPIDTSNLEKYVTPLLEAR